MNKIDFSKFKFHPVIRLPKKYDVYDFTVGYDQNADRTNPYGIGRYNEKRKNMYTGPLYTEDRNNHMGLDIGAPAGTPVYAFFDGEIFMTGYNAQEKDYGYTLITKHNFDGEDLYVLFGHLNKKSVDSKIPKTEFKTGDVLAWLGEFHENGGWFPHVHVQLSRVRPETCDMPGTVTDANLARALEIYPDPRLILGPIY